MKKLAVFILVLSCALTSKAQLTIGVKGGVNISNVINYSNVSIPQAVGDLFTGKGSEEYRLGYNAGFVLNYAIARGIVAFQPEILFSNQGVKSSGVIAGIPESSYKATIQTNYIQIPFMIQIYFVPRVLCIEIGPQVGFLIFAKGKSDYTIGGLNYSHKWDIKDGLNTVDFSLAGGFSFQIPSFPLGFNARYTIGVTNVNKDSDNGRNLNSVFQVGAFLKFGSKKQY